MNVFQISTVLSDQFGGLSEDVGIGSEPHGGL